MFLNENIRKLRESFGLSQVDLAKKLNVSKQCVSNWENDNVQPSIEMLEKLSDFFKVTTDYLLGRISEESITTGNLTTEQIAHIRLIIQDFQNCNKSE